MDMINDPTRICSSSHFCLFINQMRTLFFLQASPIIEMGTSPSSLIKKCVCPILNYFFVHYRSYIAISTHFQKAYREKNWNKKNSVSKSARCTSPFIMWDDMPPSSCFCDASGNNRGKKISRYSLDSKLCERCAA